MFIMLTFVSFSSFSLADCACKLLWLIPGDERGVFGMGWRKHVLENRWLQERIHTHYWYSKASFPHFPWVSTFPPSYVLTLWASLESGAPGGLDLVLINFHLFSHFQNLFWVLLHFLYMKYIRTLVHMGQNSNSNHKSKK